MGQIISMNKIKDDEEGIFSIREENGNLKPLEEFDGHDWEELIEVAFYQMGQMTGKSKWDVLADFMRAILEDE